MAAAVFGLVLTACGGGSQTTAEPEASQVQHTVSDKLNIYNWSDYVDPQTLSDFEKDTRLNIRYDYYDSNEALEAKLLTGKSGYDWSYLPSPMSAGRLKPAHTGKSIKSLIPNYRQHRCPPCWQ